MSKRFWWAILFLCGPALGQTAAFHGACTAGAAKAQVQGLFSTNYQLSSIPSCTVTVYLHGTTTLANIYSDSSNTPLTNSFKSPTNGLFAFYAATTSHYDIVVSAAGFTTTTTSDVQVGSGALTLPGTAGSILFNNGGVLGGSAATVDAAGNLHSQNLDYQSVANIGDSVCSGYGVSSVSGPAMPGVFGSKTPPLAYAYLLQADYGNAGRMTCYPGDEAADQALREYLDLPTPLTTGNPAVTVALGLNDSYLAGTSAAAQTTYNFAMQFIGADRGIPVSARVPATACTASGFAVDTNPPYGMHSNTSGSTLTCPSVTTYGKPLIVAFERATGWTGTMTMTVDGTPCSSGTISAAGFSTTANGTTVGLGAVACTGVAAGVHSVVYTQTNNGDSEVLFTGSAPQPDTTITSPPALWIGGVQRTHNDVNSTATALYNTLALAIPPTLQSWGITATAVDIRAATNSTTSYEANTTGNQSWCGSYPSNDVHFGCLGHYQTYLAFHNLMHPLPRNPQVTNLWAGINGTISSARSTASDFTNSAPSLTILDFKNGVTGGQTGLGFQAKGMDQVDILAGLLGPLTTYDEAQSRVPWLVTPNDDFCASVPLNSTVDVHGCSGAGFYVKGGVIGNGQVVVGPQANADADACAVGSGPCDTKSNFKVRGTANGAYIGAETSGGGFPQSYLFNDAAPSTKAGTISYVDGSGVFHWTFCTLAVGCTDHATFTPGTTAASPGVWGFDAVAVGTAVWKSGAGAPTGSCVTGSLYSNTSGGTGTTFYVCENSAWVAK